MKRRDPVTPETHAAVLARDRMCFAARITRDHECRDQWGNPHRSDDLAKLTLDHVHDHAMMGRRAPSDPAHLVAMCWGANVLGWASAHRSEERDYLSRQGATR